MVWSRGKAGFFKFKIWYLKFINNLGVLCIRGAKKISSPKSYFKDTKLQKNYAQKLRPQSRSQNTQWSITISIFYFYQIFVYPFQDQCRQN